MLRLSLVFLMVSAIFLLVATAAWAGPISSTQLIEESKVFNGRVVSYRGEVVGDVMVRRDYAWVNIHDGVNAMGVWMPAEKAEIIEIKGDYKHRGDTVEVTGVFNRACAQHGGDMDIHASEILLMKRGHPLDHPISGFKIAAAGVLSIVSGLLFLAGRRMSKRRV